LHAWHWNEAAVKLVPAFSALSRLGVSIWGWMLEKMTTALVMREFAEILSLPEAIKDGSLDLPARGARGATLVWSSSDEAVIGTDGIVTRPNAGEGDRIVLLTATITLNGRTRTETLRVNVPQRLPFNRSARFQFENTLAETLGNFGPGAATGDRLWNQGTVGFEAGHDGQSLSLNGANGVRLPDGLISNYEYTVSIGAAGRMNGGRSTFVYAPTFSNTNRSPRAAGPS
jgi:arabinan endo-1,5-alpha-L-arabinosidase